MLPSFNLISEYAPIIKYDAYKVFGFIVANNLIVIAVICFIGYFGLSFIHPAAFAMLSGALAGIYLNNNLTQFIYLLIYTSMEAFNYLMAATVSMKDAELRMSFTSFKGHLIYLLQKGIPKRKKSRFTQKMKDFILFVNVPLTVFIALIETALIVNSLGA
ncbi:hypothetical protein DRN74_04345 [Candidatus Micrarchaeota archaeon]|nr:MAG: hypothetical protein DRN74_04345 [Candidatus Micrarchaeota archaeon]